MANANRLTPETLIETRISPVIEREYKRRDIFPELRLENAARIQNGATGVHMLNVQHAQELFADAQAMQAQNRELPRGIPAAYSALARNIGEALERDARRGLWDDPGMEEMMKRASATPARLEVGDRVLYFFGNKAGVEACIVKDYRMYSVKYEDGHYISDDGKRRDYRYGYVIRVKDSSEDFFTEAHTLTRDDCKPAHLCLVRSDA